MQSSLLITEMIDRFTVGNQQRNLDLINKGST